jgi:hypothetical protein
MANKKEKLAGAMFLGKNGEVHENMTIASYCGDTVDGVPHGKGKMVLVNGNEYEGEIVMGRACGHGTWRFRDCSEYIGDNANGKPHGKGTMIFGTSGNEYTGDMANGKPHGKGMLKFKKTGDIFVGEFIRGSTGNRGKKIFGKTGDVYIGEFFDGYPHGQGSIKYNKSGETFTGTFTHGFPNEYGKMSAPNGGVSREGQISFGVFYGLVLCTRGRGKPWESYTEPTENQRKKLRATYKKLEAKIEATREGEKTEAIV